MTAKQERAKTKPVLWYAVLEDGYDGNEIADRHSVETVYAPHEERELLDGYVDRWEKWDQEGAAADAAEDYWGNHDGWESNWPLTFLLFASETGPLLVSVKVDMESVPSFTGRVCESQPVGGARHE